MTFLPVKFVSKSLFCMVILLNLMELDESIFQVDVLKLLENAGWNPSFYSTEYEQPVVDDYASSSSHWSGQFGSGCGPGSHQGVKCLCRVKGCCVLSIISTTHQEHLYILDY